MFEFNLIKYFFEVIKMSNTKLIAKNPTAYHNYDIQDKIEAGIVLISISSFVFTILPPFFILIL